MKKSKNVIESTPVEVQKFVKQVTKLIGKPTTINISICRRYVGMYWEIDTKEKYKTFSCVIDWLVCESGKVLTSKSTETRAVLHHKNGRVKDMRNVKVSYIRNPKHVKEEFDRY